MTLLAQIKGKLTFVLIIFFLVAIYLLIATKPSADKNSSPPVARLNVETERIQATSLSPTIRSYGRVQPRVLSKIIAQVTGRVDYISERFRDGGFFDKGDILLKIDETDYKNTLFIEKANLADAKRRLAEEQALAKQAETDWRRLGDGKTPNTLTLREPQLAAARANVESAKARVNMVELNLKRTHIQAPFDGRVLSTNVDLGQVVTQNSLMGDVFSTDAVEIRLPIKNNELPFLQLPERYRRKTQTTHELPDVDIISELGKVERWKGKIVRTSSSIDENSRQLYVVARIEEPFGKKAEGRFPLKIGQYVKAEIKALAIENAISIPSKSVYQGSYVYVLNDDAIFRRDIRIAWQDGNSVIIESGLRSGDVLVVSPLGQVASGTKVNVKNADGNTKKRKKWYERLPPDELKKLQERAKAQGKTIDQLHRQMRTQKKPGEVTE